MADTFAIQAAVFSDMLLADDCATDGEELLGRWGIWPETKIKDGVRTAWDCIYIFFPLVGKNSAQGGGVVG